MKTLVIGYGNCSRRDDSVGWFVVGQLEALALDGVELLTAHQLEVDHAEVVSRFDNVIFVDAAVPQSLRPVTETIVRPKLQSHAVAHYLTPADVLSLSDTLYGHMPRAFMFSVRGCDFGFGTGLSEGTEGWALEATRRITRLLTELPSRPNAMQTEREDARDIHH